MSSTSLYGNVGNVTVSSKNLTTLYNATPGNTVVANVPDRNFTTLYSGAAQTDIKPTRAYGNANVEAFLNAGTDGGNIVQNINMYGSLTVGNQSYLGNAGNVHIDGGQLNYVLSTDGYGGLFWTEQTGFATNIVPYIHFDVNTTANNQQFSDILISSYAGNTDMNVMKNGVNIEPSLFEKVNDTTIQVNIPLQDGDTIDILATGAGGGEPAGNVYEVQYNGSGVFEANASFTFFQPTSTLNVGNINTGNVVLDDVLGNTGNIANFNIVNSNISNLNITTSALLGDVSNISIGGGANGQFLQTDGNGVLSWANGGSGGTPTSLNANIGNVIINGGSNGQVLTTYGNGTLYWNTGSGGGNIDGNVYTTQGNVFGTGTILHIVTDVPTYDFSYIQFDNVPGDGTGRGRIKGDFVDIYAASAIRCYTPVAFFEGPDATVTPMSGYLAGDWSFNQGAFSGFVGNVHLGNVANVKMSGGTSGQVLSTNGSNTLSWTSTAPNAGNVTIASQPNITSFGNLTSLTVVGTTLIQQAKEKVTANNTGSTGTINYDILTQAIILKTANASANFTLNIRGNSSTTFNTFAANNESTTLTFVNKNGATGYYMTGFQIDGVSQTLLWANGSAPTTGTANGYDIYNFNIIKTGANTYAVFSTIGGYK